MKKYRLVAVIQRVRGVKGEVEVQSIDNALHLLRPQAMLFIVPPSFSGVRQTQIISSRDSTNNSWVMLDEVTDRAKATELIGRYLLADESDISDGFAQDNQLNEPKGIFRHFPVQENIPKDALGKEVYDEELGYIGVIVEESRLTPQILWTLEGKNGQVLIPAVEAFVKSWDEHNVYVAIPAGLLELNK